MAEALTVSVVMPAHNEEGSLRRVVADVSRNIRAWSHEIIIVDDGSADGTWAAIQALKRELPQVRGIRLTRNFGHQAALVAGLGAATGSGVIMMDADGQHPPDVI